MFSEEEQTGQEKRMPRATTEDLFQMVDCPTRATMEPGNMTVGKLEGFDRTGAPLVTFSGSPRPQVAARSVLALGPEHLNRELVLAFDRGDPGQPIILGAILAPGQTAVKEPRGRSALPGKAGGRLQTIFEAREVLFEGHDKVVLRCGPASITLRKDGKVIIRGESVESRSRFTNRIAGGTVKIN